MPKRCVSRAEQPPVGLTEVPARLLPLSPMRGRMSRCVPAAILRPDPLSALRGWQFAPPLHQALALRGRQLLEALEAVVQALALGRRQFAELALVGARILALFRRHLLPAGYPLADLFTPAGWQGDPALGLLQHVRLPAWRQLVPLLLQRRQHVALGRVETRPRMC